VRYIHLKRCNKSKRKEPGIFNRLQLRLLGLGGEVRHEEITKLGSSLVKVVAHTVGTDTLADDVEVEAGELVLVFFAFHFDVGIGGWEVRLTCSR
jgi:hypothetical protein